MIKYITLAFFGFGAKYILKKQIFKKRLLFFADMMDISVIIPVHNEEEILEKNLGRIYSSLEKSSLVGKFEILLCENGSKDSTPVIPTDINIYTNQA